jgi:cystathionine gamma-synthase
MSERQSKSGGAAQEPATQGTRRFSPVGADGKPLGFSTLAVHGGEPRPKLGNSLATPIVQTATYTFADTQEIHDHFQRRIEREEYGRYGNPTQRIAEQKLAALEGAEDCFFSSGMAAVTTAMYAVLSPNSHVVVTDDSTGAPGNS